MKQLNEETIAKLLNDAGLTVGRVGRPFHDTDISPKEVIMAQEAQRVTIEQIRDLGDEPCDCPKQQSITDLLIQVSRSGKRIDCWKCRLRFRQDLKKQAEEK